MQNLHQIKHINANPLCWLNLLSVLVLIFDNWKCTSHSNARLVWHSDGYFTILFVLYLDTIKIGPFDNQTYFPQLQTGLVCYSDSVNRIMAIILTIYDFYLSGLTKYVRISAFICSQMISNAYG